MMEIYFFVLQGPQADGRVLMLGGLDFCWGAWFLILWVRGVSTTRGNVYQKEKGVPDVCFSHGQRSAGLHS